MPALKGIGKKKILVEVKKADNLIRKVISENITSTNSLAYAGAMLVTETLGVKSKESWKEPMWKRRLENQIKQLHRGLARDYLLVEGKTVKSNFVDTLQKKYWLK